MPSIVLGFLSAPRDDAHHRILWPTQDIADTAETVDDPAARNEFADLAVSKQIFAEELVDSADILEGAVFKIKNRYEGNRFFVGTFKHFLCILAIRENEQPM